MKSFLLLLMMTVLLCHCAHGPRKTGGKIAEGRSSIYYYLVSNIEAYEGKGGSSFFYLDKSIKKNPSSVYLMTQKAYGLARENKLDEALKLAQKAYAKNADDPELILLLGKIHTTRRNSQTAIAFYKKVIQLDPTSEEAVNLMAREYLAIDEPRQAISVLKKFIEVVSEKPSAYFFLASIYATQEKNYRAALDVYESLLKLEPDDPKILGLMVEIYLAQKNFKKALELLQALQSTHPTDLNSQIRMALLYYELKDLDRAIGTFEDILRQNPTSDKIHYYLGLLYQDKKKTDLALKHFSAISHRSEFFVEATTRQAIIHEQEGHVDKSLVVAEKALSRQTQNAELYELVSSVYALKKDYSRALAVLKQGISRLPDHERLLFSMGVILEKMGQTEKAIEVMKKIIAINGQNALALNFVGYTYAEMGKNLPEAIELIERANTIKPNDGFITDSLGWVHFQKGNLKLATELLEKANRLSPREPTILEHLGDVYLARKDKAKARSFFETALFEINKVKNRDERLEKQLERLRQKIGTL